MGIGLVCVCLMVRSGIYIWVIVQQSIRPTFIKPFLMLQGTSIVGDVLVAVSGQVFVGQDV